MTDAKGKSDKTGTAGSMLVTKLGEDDKRSGGDGSVAEDGGLGSGRGVGFDEGLGSGIGRGGGFGGGLGGVIGSQP
jgi:hypothetical protein